ncbi:MarR family winged helix-turn-helix transcriptional regulator [Nocardioides houyundeii]|uniref:MarR family winged helix-turn-helix transcriptional regulator n=1 Tax=Nocardioides houyundeii TaxID=2045452 RepID=UPI000DF27BEC|nr:MarR family transcriptional regulator [Nocardioides houyundeii]
MSSEPDHVGRIMDQWARERPDLDVSPMGVIGRLHRLADRLQAELRPVFAAHGLGEGDFDVLATLRRSGAPYRLTPSQLADSAMVTSGAVTKRVDRLVSAGLVERSASPRDGRSCDVALTPDGLELVDRLVTEHVANEHRLLAGLGAAERSRLAQLLEQWGRAIG